MSAERIEEVLADFRTWLRENAGPSAAEGEAPAPPDLHTLLGQFVALRHEVNLQTKASRAQQEQNVETLKQLSQALEELRAVPTEEPDAEEALRPLLKALVDSHDALALAQREVRRVQQKVLPALEEMASAAETEVEPEPEPEPVEPPRPSFWARMLGAPPVSTPPAPRPMSRKQLRTVTAGLKRAGKAAVIVHRSLESVLTGYGMSLHRLERVLQEHGLETIPTVGERFDPERMEVIEVVADSGKPGGEVLEEVRRGYFWRERLFRYAQVRVAK